MSAIQPGLCSVTFRQLRVDQIIDLAAESGIAGIEWGADVHVPVGELGTAGDVARRCTEVDVACASYGTYLGAREPIADASAVVAACETAAALGTTNLRVWAQLGVDSTADDETRAPVTAGIGLAADVAARHGMTVGVEFHTGTITDTGESAARLMREVGADNLFSYWQPNFWVEQPEDNAGQLDAMRTVLTDVSHLHTFWWLARGERRSLDEGADLWTRALPEVEAAETRWTGTRYAFLEFVADDDPDRFRADAATLRGWLAD